MEFIMELSWDRILAGLVLLIFAIVFVIGLFCDGPPGDCGGGRTPFSN